MQHKIICHDCKKEIMYNENYHQYNSSDMLFNKCLNCFEKDDKLRNFRNTEVYSRVVGFIRPVNQWNAGKKQEFEERNLYKV